MSTRIEIQKWIDRAAGVPLLAPFAVAKNRRRAAPREIPRRVLLVKLWGLGNLTMFLPIARALKERDPRVVVDLLTLESNREFAAPCEYVDDVLTFDAKSGSGLPILQLLRLAMELRKRRYDVVLDGEQFLRATALLTAFSRPAFSVGFRTAGQARHHLYDVAVPCTTQRHMLHGFRDLARAGGLALSDEPARYVPRSIAAARRVTDRLATWRHGDRPLVVLHVGSGDNFIGRRWPIASFARLGDLLVAREGAEIVFTGTAAEAPLVARARRSMTAPSVDLAGRLSLLEWIELLAASNLVVANDTAPVHFAAALDVPQIAIYGPNSPRLYGPLAPRARVMYLDLACSPCLLNTNAKSSFCTRPLCMSAIDPLAVLSTAHELLALERASIAERSKR